jgi:hypothetical protein
MLDLDEEREHSNFVTRRNRKWTDDEGGAFRTLTFGDEVETQSTGIRVFTQMPAPSNENCPPMLTVRFDRGTLAPGAKEPGRAQCAMPFCAP